MNQTDLRPFLSDPAALPRSTTLLRESGLRILLLHVKDTEGIPEHHTAGAISVQCLKGEVNFFVGGEESQLTPGLLISVPPGSPHSLVARQESLLLVTISEQVIQPS